MFTKGYNQFCTTYGLSNMPCSERPKFLTFLGREFTGKTGMLLWVNCPCSVIHQHQQIISPLDPQMVHQIIRNSFLWISGFLVFFVKCKCSENQNIIHSLNSSFTKHLLLLSMSSLLDIGIKHDKDSPCSHCAQNLMEIWQSYQ